MEKCKGGCPQLPCEGCSVEAPQERMYLNELMKEAHETSISKGWYDIPPSFPEVIALMHSELSEALEEYRNSTKDRIRALPIYYSGDQYVSDAPTEVCKKPEGIGIELADCIIRIFDTCQFRGIDLEKALSIKMAYNKTRPVKHGGKTI